MRKITNVESIFVQAVRKGRWHAAAAMLGCGAVSRRDRHRAMRDAIAADDVKMAKLILERTRMEMNRLTFDEYFCQAVRRGHDGMIKLFLQNGANSSATNIVKKSVLSIAIETQNFKWVNRLLELGADVSSIDRNGLSIAMAAASGPSPQILQTVLQHGALPNYALQAAVMSNNYANVRVLLLHGADPNEANGKGITPLMVSILHGNTRIIELLVKYGADLDKQDVNGDTALIYAGRHGRSNLFRLLIGLGAAANITNRQGENAYDAVLGRKLDRH